MWNLKQVTVQEPEPKLCSIRSVIALVLFASFAWCFLTMSWLPFIPIAVLLPLHLHLCYKENDDEYGRWDEDAGGLHKAINYYFPFH